MKKTSQLEPLRLAKKWNKSSQAHRTEKQVLLAIAETCSMRDLECRKAPRTIDAERGISRSEFKRGIQGRRRADGSECYPGLIKRGIVFPTRGACLHSGVPTAYSINMEVLRRLADGDESQPEMSPNMYPKMSPNSNGDVSNASAEMSPNQGV